VELLFFIERALWVVTLIVEALLVLRLVRDGLLRRYPLFAAFLTAEIVCSVALMQTDMKSRVYAEAFRTCTLIMTVFRLGFAAELYERICEHFPGIGKFRLGLAAGVVFIAALIAAFTFRPNLANQWGFPQTVVLVVLRFQNEIFAAALALTWVFLRYVLSIRQPFQPNILRHWGIATIYFGAAAAANLAILVSGGGAPAVFPINSALLAVHLICFLAWFRLMRRSGEKLPPFQRLLPDEVQAVERYNRELMETVTSLPGQISARQSGNPNTPLRRARLH
jgi:hypothetical protein